MDTANEAYIPALVGCVGGGVSGVCVYIKTDHAISNYINHISNELELGAFAGYAKEDRRHTSEGADGISMFLFTGISNKRVGKR